MFTGFGPEGSRRRRIPSRSAASFDEGQFKHPRSRLEQSNGKGQGPTSIRRCAGTSSTAASAFPRHSALRRTAALSFSQHPAAPQQIDNRIRQPPAPSRQLFNSRQLRDTPAFRPFRSCAGPALKDSLGLRANFAPPPAAAGDRPPQFSRSAGPTPSWPRDLISGSAGRTFRSCPASLISLPAWHGQPGRPSDLPTGGHRFYPRVAIVSRSGELR